MSSQNLRPMYEMCYVCMLKANVSKVSILLLFNYIRKKHYILPEFLLKDEVVNTQYIKLLASKKFQIGEKSHTFLYFVSLLLCIYGHCIYVVMHLFVPCLMHILSGNSLG